MLKWKKILKYSSSNYYLDIEDIFILIILYFQNSPSNWQININHSQFAYKILKFVLRKPLGENVRYLKSCRN